MRRATTLIPALLILTLPLGVAGCDSNEMESQTPTVKPQLPFAQELQDALDNAFHVTNGMGVPVAINVPEYQTWLGVSGISHSGTPIAPDILFDIGSTEKNFQSVLVLNLVEDGVLRLDDPLHKWLLDYPNIDNTITIRQLLNLTSGIDGFVGDANSPWRVDFNNIDYTKEWTPEEIIETFVGESEFAPGTSRSYSTTNYILLKMIV